MDSKFDTVVLDIETDSLNATKIHCICIQDYATGEQRDFIQEQGCEEFKQFHNDDRKYIMHNGISFDGPVLERLLGITIPLENIIDTLLISQMINAHIDGGHSLKSWGKKLTRGGKLEFKDFDQYSEEMLKYCQQDVHVTRKLMQHLAPKITRFSTESVRMEHRIRRIIDQQEKNGFYLNVNKAHDLLEELKTKSEDLKKDLQTIFPTIYTPRFHKTTGKPLKDNVDEFNPSSRKQVAERLQKKYNWVPKKTTPTGLPVIDEKVLKELEYPEAKMIAEYLLYEKRVSQIQSWLKNVKDDNRVHGKVITLGCVTSRMSHYGPNMAQVPASYSPYGKECRSLWTIENPDKYCLVGSDASGLELRCFAHYLQNPKFTEQVVDGDIHTYNQNIIGLKDRPTAKTWVYAFIYGAGDAKLGQIVGGNTEAGLASRKRFINKVKGMKTLTNNLINLLQQRKRKYGEYQLVALDKRILLARSIHSSLNTLIQGAGAIICKQWLLNIIDEVDKQNVDAKPVANVHDEVQFEVRKEQAVDFGNITKEAMKRVEKQFNLRCPLDSEYSIGTTWKETH
jgi:DNA polymerase I-like protein with 3'-5' exonuclease and polymerase domains